MVRLRRGCGGWGPHKQTRQSLQPPAGRPPGSEKAVVCRAGGGPSPGTEAVGISVLDLASRTVSGPVSVVSRPARGIVWGQPEQIKTLYKEQLLETHMQD